jgi:hypothetical protein
MFVFLSLPNIYIKGDIHIGPCLQEDAPNIRKKDKMHQILGLIKIHYFHHNTIVVALC